VSCKGRSEHSGILAFYTIAPVMDSLVVSSTKVENPEVLAPDPKTLVPLLYTVPFSSV
jgi:hypothetical protein